MAPVFFEFKEESKHRHWVGTLGGCRCKVEYTSGSAMPLNGTEQSYSDREKELTNQQQQKLWLVERRNQEMKRAWKKDQLYNSRQQVKI